MEREEEKNSDEGLAFQILQHTEKSLWPCNYDMVRNDKENQHNRLGNPKVGSRLCKILVNEKYGILINEAYRILVFSNLKENKNGFLS